MDHKQWGWGGDDGGEDDESEDGEQWHDLQVPTGGHDATN